MIQLIKKQFNRDVKGLHSDRGGEFLNEILETYCTENGIIHTTTTANTPHRNGLAENINGILIVTSRAIIVHANAPPRLWGEALITSSYLRNRQKLKKLNNKTPYEKVFGKAPSENRLRVWGCDAYVHNVNDGSKFGQVKVPGIFIGYSEQQYAYRIQLADGTIRISKDITFIEDSFKFMAIYHLAITGNKTGTLNKHTANFYTDSEEAATDIYTINTTTTDTPITEYGVSSTVTTTAVSDATQTIHYSEDDISFDIDPEQDLLDNDSFVSGNESDNESNYKNDYGFKSEKLINKNEYHSSDDSESETNTSIDSTADLDTPQAASFITAAKLTNVIPPRTTRVRHDPNFYAASQMDNYVRDNDNFDNDLSKALKNSVTSFLFEDLSQLTYNQAMKRSDAAKWTAATQKELDSIIEKEVGTEVPLSSLPSGTKPLTCRLLFKIKYNDKNEPIQWKTRLVVQGFKQTYGLDYTETFAPTAKAKSIKLMLSTAAIKKQKIKQCDINVAFLNAKLTDIVYIILPNGCGELSGKIWKLNKALYGLKQAPHEWNTEMNKTLISLNYIPTKADPCIYVKRIPNTTEYITVYLYVDDIISTFVEEIEYQWDTDFNVIKSKYDLKDLGDCAWILNMKVIRDYTKGTIILSQEAYIRQALIDRGIDINTFKTRDNPCNYSESHIPTDTTSELLNPTEHQQFQSDIGTLNYAALMTRFDITYAVIALSRKLAAPTKNDAIAVNRIFRYLAGTVHYALVFKKPIKLTGIVAYSDASYANDTSTYKGTSGSLITVDGNVICVRSKRQKCVALSSTEAEYYAMGSTVCEALWIQLWRKEVTGVNQIITVLCDNQSAMKLASHDTIHQRSKHINIRYHFIRDHIAQGSVQIEWVSTNYMLADILTKAMVTPQFKTLVNKILLC